MAQNKWMDEENMVLVCIHIYLYTHTHAHTHTCTHTHTGILLSLNKGGHSAICNNMDEPGGQYTKWNKPDTEGQILHDITAIVNLKESKSQKQSRMVVARV